jgi:hypothetical protein
VTKHGYPRPPRPNRLRLPRLLCAVLILAAAAAPAPALAQAGAGTAAGAVLQIPAGSRASGLAGAYTAATGADAIFYNPAAPWWQAMSATASYQRHMMDAGYSSFAAASRLRYLSIGVTFTALDFGSIDELVPDPAFDGQRGIETGERVGASDVVARAVLAVPLHRRLALGGAFGLYWSTLAESVRTVELFDAGVQFRARDNLTLGAALRNGGGPLAGAGLEPADLPSEVRVGAAWTLPLPVGAGVQAAWHADVVFPRHDAPNALVAGLEVGNDPAAPLASLAGQSLSGAFRAGYNGATGRHALGRFHYGAGLSLDGLSIDYTLQPMGELGTAHRFGLRWTPGAAPPR